MSESKDVAIRDESASVPATSAGVIGGVLAMAKDASIDAAKVETLTKLAIELQDRERRAEFNRSKIAAIREMPAIYKRGKSDKHRYAKFEDLHRAVMPILARHGLTIDFRVGSGPKGVSVTPILRHENGHVEEGEAMEGPPDTGPGRSAIQAIGSSTSYLKRHSMKATLNIIEDGEDNDGIGFRPEEQKNDRQERLILDAEAAAATGEYAAWYQSQSSKDRSWLVLAGVHARCGGGAALPPPAGSSPLGREEARRDDPVDAEFEPADDKVDPVDEPEPDPKTAEGWTTIYERRCKAAETLDDLADIQAAGANAIKKLEQEKPDLHKRVIAANGEAYGRLSGTDGAAK
jgi:hypothetical protein